MRGIRELCRCRADVDLYARRVRSAIESGHEASAAFCAYMALDSAKEAIRLAAEMKEGRG